MRPTASSLLTYLLIAIVSGYCGFAAACAWDDDTLREEASGKRDVLDTIMGRFDVFPPKYYEMRLERVTKSIAADPTTLTDYDNACIACDRLGRNDEAVEWMARKRAIMDSHTFDAETKKEHEYRYAANLGTVLAHRWVANGMKRDAMDDLFAAATGSRRPSRSIPRRTSAARSTSSMRWSG